MIFDRLIEKIIATQNPTCVGLDTSFDYLPEEMKEGVTDYAGAGGAIFEFNKRIIDYIYDLVPAVKVQIAYYEQYGEPGLAAFGATCEYAARRGLIVITDAKRNDIGATAARYSASFLGETVINGNHSTPYPSDLLTVNGYLGTDGIAPFLADCEAYDKGIFVLVKTSNPSSGELQDLRLADGRTVYERMGDMVENWGADSIGKYGYSRVGAVVGATHPEEARVLRARLPHTFFLIPGYGAQGGNADTVRACFVQGGMGGVVNNSRGIICAYQKRGGTFYEAAREAVLEMKADLRSVLGEICAK